MDSLTALFDVIVAAATDLISTQVPGSLLVLSVFINIVLVYRYVRLALKKGNQL